jgi:hypothetical protein
VDKGPNGGVLRSWAYRRVLRDYLPGLRDTWAAEWEDIRRSTPPDAWDKLIEDLDENGIEKPILLGYDGRVWDGHHRLWWAMTHDHDIIPVEVLPSPESAA